MSTKTPEERAKEAYKKWWCNTKEPITLFIAAAIREAEAASDAKWSDYVQLEVAATTTHAEKAESELEKWCNRWEEKEKPALVLANELQRARHDRDYAWLNHDLLLSALEVQAEEGSDNLIHDGQHINCLSCSRIRAARKALTKVNRKEVESCVLSETSSTPEQLAAVTKERDGYKQSWLIRETSTREAVNKCAQLREQVAKLTDGRDLILEDLDEALRQLTQSQAECAAMREALEYTLNSEVLFTHVLQQINQALSSTAGTDFLAQLAASLRPSVEVSILRADGQMLAIRTTKYGGGFYGVGGKVEKGETFDEAARRELLEETGCEALSLRFIAGRTLDPLPQDPGSGMWYCAGFVAEIGDQEPRKCEAHTEPFWTSRENMRTNSLFPEWYCWWIDLLDLLARLKAAEEDVRRLNWCDANKEQLFCIGWNRQDRWVISAEPRSSFDGAEILGEAPTIRAALDAALATGTMNMTNEEMTSRLDSLRDNVES